MSQFHTKIFFILLSQFFSFSYAQNYRLDRSAGEKMGIRDYQLLIPQLVNDGFYYAALPLAKEILSLGDKQNLTNEFEDALDEIILGVGVRQFELLPSTILQQSKAPSVRYILAKKYFRENQIKKAYEIIKNYPRNHGLSAFALHLEATALSIMGDHEASTIQFKNCKSLAEQQMGDTSKKLFQRELKILADYCLLGPARNSFAQKQYEKASSGYLDLDKSSFVWPSILFEEAWTDFYLKNHNRTLGKLVTYNSPFLDHIFNPEIFILESLSYFDMCLFDDAKKSVDAFYTTFEKHHEYLRTYLQTHENDLDFFYETAKKTTKSQVEENPLVHRILKNIVNGETYADMVFSLRAGIQEYAKIKNYERTSQNVFFMRNILDGLKIQKKLIGNFVKAQLRAHEKELEKSFEDMSYIKLEVLSKSKTNLYQGSEGIDPVRGDVKYLKRSSKQYFWSFNGEFWADELGDYVFALKSECRG